MLTITLHIYWVLPRHSWHTVSFIPHNRPVRLLLLLCPVKRWETKAGGLKFSAQGHTASKWHSQDSNTTSNKCFWAGLSDTPPGWWPWPFNEHLCVPACVCVCVCVRQSSDGERERKRENILQGPGRRNNLPKARGWWRGRIRSQN